MTLEPNLNNVIAGERSRRERRARLRSEMVAKRQALSPESHAELSACIVNNLIRHLPQLAGATIGFCWPIKKEPDVRAALLHWAAVGSRAALPVVVTPDAPLAFREWTPATPMRADGYGIPTPAAGDWLTPDALLLPLNAFDAKGYRLGYGGGYFDRTLAALSPRPLAIGVGFEMNRVESIEPETHDQRLDCIVTESTVVWVDRNQEA